MTYLLDTNAVSALMRADARMASWLSSIGVDDRVAICTIVRSEILFGLERLAPGRRRSELEGKAGKLFAVLPCEPIPPAAGDQYAHVKVSQQRRGLPLDENENRLLARGSESRKPPFPATIESLCHSRKWWKPKAT